jgi:hypothetical protein
VTGCGLDEQGSVSGMGRDVCLRHHVHSGCGAHLGYHPMGTFLGGKAVGT